MLVPLGYLSRSTRCKGDVFFALHMSPTFAKTKLICFRQFLGTQRSSVEWDSFSHAVMASCLDIDHYMSNVFSSELYVIHRSRVLILIEALSL